MVGIVGTVPVVLPCLGLFLEDVLAAGAEDVVAETEVFVEHHGAFEDPLMAVFTLLFIRAGHCCVFVHRYGVLWFLGVAIRCRGLEL